MCTKCACTHLLSVSAISVSPPRRAGEDQGHARRIFLIYDGIHYDCIVERPSPAGGEERRIFDGADADALDGATALGAEANRARQFTDLSAFALRCLVCGRGLTGAADAQAHAAATGHTNFAEK
jgi:ubiquitin thioesterase OTU1